MCKRVPFQVECPRECTCMCPSGSSGDQHGHSSTAGFAEVYESSALWTVPPKARQRQRFRLFEGEAMRRLPCRRDQERGRGRSDEEHRRRIGEERLLLEKDVRVGIAMLEQYWRSTDIFNYFCKLTADGAGSQ